MTTAIETAAHGLEARFGTVQAWQLAADSDHPEYAPSTEFNLEGLREKRDGQ
jgi:hypothetical protein